MIAKLIVLVTSTLSYGNMPSLRSCVRSSRGPPRNEVAVDGTNCSIDVIGAVVDVSTTHTQKTFHAILRKESRKPRRLQKSKSKSAYTLLAFSES